jgi:SAM-dependent methyltransferase
VTAGYLSENRAHWDDRAAAHAASPDYCVERFISDPAFLSRVVRFDRRRLGDVTGISGLHLQCHIGTDTISLARLGASMTGLDFSPASLAHARDLAKRTGAAVRFVEADVYDAGSVLRPGQFDLVYTGIGALHYLPDIRRWASAVADLLRPGGRLFMREQHPLISTLSAKQPARRLDGSERLPDGLLVIDETYFERTDPVTFTTNGTYVTTDALFEHTTIHLWNHGLGEIVTALLDAGMRLTGLEEHDSVPFEALPGQMERVGDTEEWRLSDRPWRLPMSYTLQAAK